MKSFLTKIADAPYAIAAAATVALMSSEDAMAQSSTIGDAADGLKDDIGNLGKLAVGTAFLAGLVFIATGLLKLKQAADTQGQQVKYGDGLWRLAAGAGLVGIPALTGMLSETLGLGGTSSITEAGGVDF